MKRVVAALILENDRILACQRTRHQIMPLKWEFPGGKIETGEQPSDALRRELDEELGIDAVIGDEVARLRHTYPRGGVVELRFFGGLTEEETAELMKEAIEFHLEGLKEDKIPIPEPTISAKCVEVVV